jgi:hypothetical protein
LDTEYDDIEVKDCSMQLLVKHKNVDCQKEDQRNGNHTVEDQHKGKLILDHAKQSSSKGNQDQS